MIRHEMTYVKFSGEPSIEILRFLARFKSVCNENDISEQAALILLQNGLPEKRTTIMRNTATLAPGETAISEHTQRQSTFFWESTQRIP